MATLAVMSKAKAIRASEIDVIDLGIGEPDFDTQIHIKNAAQEAMEKGHTKYTPVGGVDALKGDALKGDALKGDALKGDALKGDAQKGDALKDAILDRISLDLGLSYCKEEMIASSGGKHVLYNPALTHFNLSMTNCQWKKA